MSKLNGSVFVLGLFLSVCGNVGYGQDIEKGLAAARSGDFATALNEWQPLANQGDAEAQFYLGRMYAYGDGLEQDYSMALEFFRLSAEQGHAGAANFLGLMYQSGRGVTQDYVEAVKWYRLSAEQGNAGAQGNLGQMYAVGMGVIQDYISAHMWANIAASLGNADGGELRDAVSKVMTVEQIAEAQLRARECVVKNYLDC